VIIRFNERFSLPLEEVYTYFETPADWARLFGFAGTAKELEDGWYEVPLKRFPFPLVARYTEHEPRSSARWVFRGFWRGRGEVRFSRADGDTIVEGFEEISVRPLFFLSPLAERLLLERGFRAVWAVGWHRLREREAAQSRPVHGIE
jgi:hypothetical protein